MAEPKTTPRAISWRAWPLVEYPGRSAAAAAAVIGAGAAIYLVWDTAFFGALGAALLALSLHGHLLPRRYRLDDDGVSVSVMGIKKSRPWDYFHSYYADRLGAMLSTFTYPSRLDSFRGVNLRFARGNRDDVVAFVGARLPRAEKRQRRGSSGE
jgi:hypothetical protein